MSERARSSFLRELTEAQSSAIAGGGPNYTVTNNSGSSSAGSKVAAATALISAHYGSLNGAGQNGANSVVQIVIDPASSGRSYMDIAHQTFHINATEALQESSAYVAADIIHDGTHYVQYFMGQQSSGVGAEQAATQVELQNAGALGLTTSETKFLNDYMNNPNLIQGRIDEPVFVTPANTSTSSTAAPDPNDPAGFFDDDYGYTGNYQYDQQFFPGDYSYDRAYVNSSSDYGFYNYSSSIAYIGNQF